jgi:DNA-binding transcriptional ArsR family regulator
VSSPYEVAEACHQLGDARYPRDVRPDEVRYALATLDVDALGPECPPTVRAVLATLLRAERRLSAADLAARADVSPRSLSRHRATLEALALVDVTAEAPEEGGGWRLTLAFRTDAERADTRLPASVATGTRFGEVVSDVAAALLPPEEYADPGGRVYETLSYPPDPWALVEDPRLEPWVRLAARLVGADPPTPERTVRMGPTIEQTPLAAADTTAATENTPHAI